MGIRDYSNNSSHEYLENLFPNTRTDNEPLYLPFLHPPSAGNGQIQCGSSTDGKSMTINGRCEEIGKIKHIMTQYSMITSDCGSKHAMRHHCKICARKGKQTNSAWYCLECDVCVCVHVLMGQDMSRSTSGGVIM
eukprot:5841882-Ditylum_brightwellii.AAC.1